MAASGTGVGDVGSPKPARVTKDYLGLLQGYSQAIPGLLESWKKYFPEYTSASLADMSRLQPGVSSLMRGTNPAQQALLDKLTEQAGSAWGVDSTAGFDPALLRLAQQSVRARQQGTLSGTGNAGNYGEALGVSAFANDLRQQNRVFAGNVAGWNNAYRDAPTWQMLAGISGAGQGALMTPAQSADLMKTVYGGKLSAATSTAANNTGLWQSANSSFLGI